MPEIPSLWIRHETRRTERRAPIAPDEARILIAHGFQVTVEESPQRVFPLADYVAAGCRTAQAGAWAAAPDRTYIVGLKELPEEPYELRHRHIYFGHAYRGQAGAGLLLRRFAEGGGTLLDLEYLVADDGRRLAAFGYWAGYAGAALAVLHRRGALVTPLVPHRKEQLDEALRSTLAADQTSGAVVIGALGRCGRGARDALTTADIEPICWDIAETGNLDRDVLLANDILVNAVRITRPVPPFLTERDLGDPARRLSLICDVTCDVTAECNVLPVYDRVTDWDRPVRRLRGGDFPVDLIAIDNLPSLLPAEASRDFSADLLGPLLSLDETAAPVWVRCLEAFSAATSAQRETDDAIPRRRARV